MIISNLCTLADSRMNREENYCRPRASTFWTATTSTTLRSFSISGDFQDQSSGTFHPYRLPPTLWQEVHVLAAKDAQIVPK